MPQMAPINWLMLFLMFLIMLFILMNILFFSFIKLIYIKNKILNIKKMMKKNYNKLI